MPTKNKGQLGMVDRVTAWLQEPALEIPERKQQVARGSDVKMTLVSSDASNLAQNVNNKISPLGRVSLWLGDKFADWVFEYEESRPDSSDTENKKEKKSNFFEDLARVF